MSRASDGLRGVKGCASRRLFLTLKAPLVPLAPNGLHHAVASRLEALGIRCPRTGPHALRHACATHLVAEGLSLKQIGDHLGHLRLDGPAERLIVERHDLVSGLIGDITQMFEKAYPQLAVIAQGGSIALEDIAVVF